MTDLKSDGGGQKETPAVYRGHSKWRYFLPSTPEKVRNELLIDDEGLYSVSCESHADVMTAILRHLWVETVLDGTACVGGNVHSMATADIQVWACEKNACRFDLLKHNLSLLQDYYCYDQQPKLLHCSVHEVLAKKHPKLPAFPVGAIVLDPPWGGPDYIKKERMELYLDGIPLRKIVKHAALRKRSQIFQLKVPKNYDMDQLLTCLEEESRLLLQLVLDVQLDKFDVLTLVFFDGTQSYVSPQWLKDILVEMPGVQKVNLLEQRLKSVAGFSSVERHNSR